MEENTKSVKKQTFMMSVLTILTAQILIKALGFIYRFVITNIPGFGDAGNGYYGAGFQIYMLLLAVSSMGIPGAIAKIVSERIALNDYKGAHKVFKTALILFAAIGSVGVILLICSAKWLAYVVLDNPGVEYVLVALAPSVFFVCVSAVIRGYFNGMQNMKATARSQTLEQIFNCIFTITIVYILSGGGNALVMATGSSIATTLATMISFSYLLLFYNRKKKEIWKGINEKHTSTTSIKDLRMKRIVKSILAISIPISMSSIISAINRTVDATTVLRGIKASMGYTDEVANYWYGILSGKVDMLTSFPLALNIAFAVALIPAISSAFAIGDKETAKKRTSFSMLITVLFSLPCTVGMIVLADPILHLLFPNASEGALLLQISAMTIIFTALAQTINGALQGMGKVFVPAIALGCGCIIKIILNIVLIYNPTFNIYGAAIASVVCHIVSFTISFYVLNRNMNVNINKIKFIFKPLIATVTMGLLTFLSYKLLFDFVGQKLSTIIAIGVAVIVYIIMILALKVMDKEDFYMIPGGGNIIKILQKLKIY